MTWQEALEALTDHPHAWRYRQLCADNNPNDRQREKYRDVVIRKATGEYPPVVVQAGNALAAAGRFVASGFKVVDELEYERRLNICQACPEYDAAAKRCRKCGCFTAAKLRAESERCPLDPPKW